MFGRSLCGMFPNSERERKRRPVCGKQILSKTNILNIIQMKFLQPSLERGRKSSTTTHITLYTSRDPVEQGVGTCFLLLVTSAPLNRFHIFARYPRVISSGVSDCSKAFIGYRTSQAMAVRNIAKAFFSGLGKNLSVPKQARISRPSLSVFYRFSSSDSAAYTATYDFETLTVTAPDDHILHVQLNRPECYNAMNKMFWREMLDCFRKIRDDRYCRAVIISGSGQLFSAGLDYSDMQDLTSQVAGKGDVARKAKFLLSLIAKYQESFNAVENCQKPVIAAIHGKCSGGGVDLICACDIRYCSEDAFFEIEEVDVGMAADMGTLQRLPKIVGNDSLVREYAFSCAKIEPAEAKTIGLVGRVFPTKEAMMTSALNLAKVIASKSPVAIQGTKVALNFSRDHSVADGLQFMTYWNMTMLQSEDVLKAAEATINKSDKPPKYSKL